MYIHACISQQGFDLMDNLILLHKGTLIKNEDILSFAKEGCILEYDLFGIETSHYQLCDTVDMPSDAQRIQRIKLLIENGYEDNITIAHDIHTKHRLVITLTYQSYKLFKTQTSIMHVISFAVTKKTTGCLNLCCNQCNKSQV